MNPKTRLRGVVTALLVLVLLAPAATPAAPAQSSGPVKLVVIVSVDGLAWPRLAGYRPWFQEGFKRLLDEGQVETKCNYGHINTETGPGHASLGTGAPPRVHGIVANRWFEANAAGDGLISVYCTDQPNPQATGASARPIPGPANLRIPTFGDRLVEASPSSRVVSLSGKDRGSIFLAGKNPAHVVYWYDRDSGRYVSSAAYDTANPIGSAARDLIQSFNQKRAGWQLASRFGTEWSPLPMPLNESSLPQPETNLVRYQAPDWGVGFNHYLLGSARGYFDGIYNSPFQDQLLADLALTVLDDPTLALGRRGVPDLLAVSFSANDVASHNYGSESAEALDTLRRLDIQLGRLLARLDALAAAEPKGQVVLALSADHGFTPLPEIVRRNTGKRVGGRLPSPESNPETFFPNMQERLNRTLVQELCLPLNAQPIAGMEGWNVAYNPKQAARVEDKDRGCPADKAGQAVTWADIDTVLERIVRLHYGEEVEKVLLVSQAARWPADDRATLFAQNDFDAKRSSNAFLIPKEYVLMHWDPVRGSGHGSHHEYDTNVPLIFWGGPFKANERTDAAAPYDLAPTLADILGIKLPDATGTSRLKR